MHAEAGHRERGERQRGQAGAAQRAQALAPARRGEHHEGEREPRGHLHRQTRREHARRLAPARAGAGGQRQRDGEQQHQQGVVVRAADGEHEHHGIQPDEGRGPAGRVTEAGGRACDQRHGAEAAQPREGLQNPQPPGEPQRRGRVACEREQRAVGGVLEDPAQERVHGVRGRLGGRVRVGIEAVQGAQAGEREVAEDVLGDQRRPQEQDQVGDHDAGRDRAHRQRSSAHEHEHVARAHQQHECLEAVLAQRGSDALQRAGQPAGPAATARGHEFRWFGRGVGAQQQDGRDHAEQPERAEGAQRRRRGSPAGRAARSAVCVCGGAHARGGGCSSDVLHCCVWARVQVSSVPASL